MSFNTESFDIEQCFNESFEAYRKNFLVFILASLTLFILGPLTIFILMGPLQAGLMMMILSSIKGGEKPKFDDLFEYFKKFGSLLFGFYIPAVFSIIGFFFFIIPGLFIITLWMYVLLLIVEKDLDVVSALKTSWNIVMKNNIWKHFILIIIVIGIQSIVSIQQGPFGLIFAILVFPLTLGLIVSAYNQLAEKGLIEIKNNTQTRNQNTDAPAQNQKTSDNSEN